jgi:hypothetical protein
MLAKLLSFWVVGSLVIVVISIIGAYAGASPIWEDSWFKTVLIGLTPIGALCGWLFLWIFSVLLGILVPGMNTSSLTRTVSSASTRWTGRHYDASGQYRGETTKDGRHYDASGQYMGETTKDGRHYDASGQYKGETTKDGRHYDASGQYRGETTEDGRHYDASGQYEGVSDKD